MFKLLKRTETEAVDPNHTPRVRWMMRRDLTAVVSIEEQCFDFPWSEDDLCAFLCDKKSIGLVAEIGEHVIGYMLYKLFPTRLKIETLAICSAMQRRGFGSIFIERLKGKLCRERRNRIDTVVAECNIDAQMFFKRHGFICTRIEKGRYEDCDQDALHFVYRHEWSD